MNQNLSDAYKANNIWKFWRKNEFSCVHDKMWIIYVEEKTLLIETEMGFIPL